MVHESNWHRSLNLTVYAINITQTTFRYPTSYFGHIRHEAERLELEQPCISTPVTINGILQSRFRFNESFLSINIYAVTIVRHGDVDRASVGTTVIFCIVARLRHCNQTDHHTQTVARTNWTAPAGGIYKIHVRRCVLQRFHKRYRQWQSTQPHSTVPS